MSKEQAAGNKGFGGRKRSRSRSPRDGRKSDKKFRKSKFDLSSPPREKDKNGSPEPRFEEPAIPIVPQ